MLTGSHVESLMSSVEEETGLTERMEAIESSIIRKTLEATNWQQSEAARKLGLKRSSLQYKVKKFHLAP